MTDQHPLTDDIAESIAVTDLQCPFGIGELVFTHADMRSAADWQLEQVLRFMEDNGFGIRKILLLKDAMRPLHPVREEDNND